MTSQYENLATPDAWTEFFKVTPAFQPSEHQMRARRLSGFIRGKVLPASTVEQVQMPAIAGANDSATNDSAADVIEPKKSVQVEREWVVAQWGMVPSWVKSAKDGNLRAPKLLVALNETVSTAQAFRDAWLKGQRCIIPMQAFYVDDMRSGKTVPTRIARVDGAPMGVAGVWDSWIDPENGKELLSYALLTINANSHALMRRYGPQGAERRMPAILGEGTYDAWLTTRQEKAREFMRAYPANWLLANPVENKKDKKPKGLFD